MLNVIITYSCFCVNFICKKREATKSYGIFIYDYFDPTPYAFPACIYLIYCQSCCFGNFGWFIPLQQEGTDLHIPVFVFRKWVEYVECKILQLKRVYHCPLLDQMKFSV